MPHCPSPELAQGDRPPIPLAELSRRAAPDARLGAYLAVAVRVALVVEELGIAPMSRRLHKPLAHPQVFPVSLVAPLDLDDRLQKDRFLAERGRLDYRAVRSLILDRSRLEDDGVPVGAADAPQGSATSDKYANGKLFTCPANLDLAVGKAQPQDRCVRYAVVDGHGRVTSAPHRLAMTSKSIRNRSRLAFT